MGETPGSTRAGGLTYADSGVSIEAGDEAVRRIQQHIRRTQGPRVIDNPGGFAGLFRLDFNEQLFRRNYRDPVLVACTDGVGTKVLLAIEMGVHDTVGVDLVAMSVNDLIVQGAEPLLFLDYIGIYRVDPALVERLVAGVARGCEIAGCALVGGETAEMPDVYKPGDYDLAGFAVGVVELSRAMDTARVEPGDVVLGLESDGVHSNGYTLVRKIVATRKLKLGQIYPELDAERTLGEVLLTPTRIYCQPVVRAQRAYKVKKVVSGMAHITGGGIAGNLVRSLHPGVDAVIDWDAWETPAVFRFLAERGGVEEAEMRRVFNMGIGYCLIVRPTFAEAIKRRLARMGERVHVIGKIAKGKGRVTDKKRGR
ncbi:MAG: phosphoribosylformylglycinamidine cyclo-ligase [Phycisphaeraceae bacterium]|nr:MAG: phosphoribosylformylglycinamidine cyclo-ligase [Phycisphaeraceae bacterium]